MANQIKRPGKRSSADEAMVNDLVDGIYRFSEKRYPFLVGTIVWVFDFITRSLAFNIRAITRIGPGRRTFGLFLLIFSYYLQKYILFFIWEPGEVEFDMLWKVFDEDEEIGRSFHFFSSYTPSLSNLKEQLREADNILEMIKIVMNNLTFFYGYLVLLAGVGQILSALSDRFNRVKAHSYSTGVSLIGEWFVGTRLGNFVVTSRMACVYIEPPIVFLIGLLFWKFASSEIGIFWMICSVAVFYEEYKPYARRRAKIQDKIDAEFEVEYLREGLSFYDATEKNKNGASSKVLTPVAFASSSDASRYRSEMKKIASSSSAVGLG